MEGGLFWEVHQRRKADDQAAANRRDAEASDARLVTAIFTRSGKFCTADVRNDAAGPIKDILLWLVVQSTGESLLPGRVGPSVAVVGAHAEERFHLMYESVVPKEGVDSVIEFTDSQGLRWQITNRGQPVRVWTSQGTAGPSHVSGARLTWVAVLLGAVGILLALAALITR